MFKKPQELGGVLNTERAEKKDTTESIIGPSVHLEGNFNSSGNIVIGGSLTGSMTTSGDVHVLEGARVNATLAASHVLVSGEVRGDVKATERLELAPTARVMGNVEAKILSVAPGAVLHGKCAMKNNKSSEKQEAKTTKSAAVKMTAAVVE